MSFKLIEDVLNGSSLVLSPFLAYYVSIAVVEKVFKKGLDTLKSDEEKIRFVAPTSRGLAVFATCAMAAFRCVTSRLRGDGEVTDYVSETALVTNCVLLNVCYFVYERNIVVDRDDDGEALLTPGILTSIVFLMLVLMSGENVVYRLTLVHSIFSFLRCTEDLQFVLTALRMKVPFFVSVFNDNVQLLEESAMCFVVLKMVWDEIRLTIHVFVLIAICTIMYSDKIPEKMEEAFVVPRRGCGTVRCVTNKNQLFLSPPPPVPQNEKLENAIESDEKNDDDGDDDML